MLVRNGRKISVTKILESALPLNRHMVTSMTVKLSRKNLEEVALNLGAISLGKNCYKYESLLGRIREFDFGKLSNPDAPIHNEQRQMIFDCINSNQVTKRTEVNQVAYACGRYGNIGQLHRVKFYEYDKLLATMYFYYVG